MDKLQQFRIFTRVADLGSFIKASQALDLPRTTVSAAIQDLEAKLGARLLHRTTRRVQLTVDGEQLLERVRTLLGDVDDIDSLFLTRQQAVMGRLNVDVPSRIARRVIIPALPGLLRKHPQLQLGLGSTDRTVDLVQEGVDCAVRVGDLQNSSLVVRPLGHVALVNCASPQYLRRQGVPQQPGDLMRGHAMVGYAAGVAGREQPWEYLQMGKLHHLRMPSPVVVQNAEGYIACCLAGIGLIQIPRYDVKDLIDGGELVEVMPEFRASPMPISLLYPHRRQRSPRVSAFSEWFEALMRPYLDSVELKQISVAKT
jgi:DNA-binding transcriptional LysR family regulator